MNIAYILTTFPSRTETFAAREIEALTQRGFSITVLAADRGNGFQPESERAVVYYRPARCSWEAIVAVVSIFSRYPLGVLRLLGLLCRLAVRCPREAATVLGNLHTIGFFARRLDEKAIGHLHAYFLSWPACIGLALAVMTRRRLSIAVHARDIFVEPGALRLKIARAAFVVACTRQGWTALMRQLPRALAAKVHLNYHGIPLNGLPTEPRTTPKGAQVLAVGRLVPKKGFDYLVKAFAVIRPAFSGACLTIAGEGPERRHLEELSRQLHVEDQIRLVGWQANGNVLDMIRSASVLAVPSVIGADGDRDGIPNVILEAFALGTPVVASALDGIREAVIDQETGLLVEAAHVRELASALAQLLRDEPLQRRLSQKARTRVTQMFNVETNVGYAARLFEGGAAHPPTCAGMPLGRLSLLMDRHLPSLPCRPKVVHIVEPFIGGICTYLRTVLPRLADQGFDVTLVCSLGRNDPEAPAILADLRTKGVDVHIVPMVRSVNPIQDLRSLAALCRILAGRRFDIVHTHCSKAGLLGRLAAHLTGQKVILHTPHCFAFLRETGFSRHASLLLERLLGRLTTRLIAVSGSEMKAAVRCGIVPATKCDAINNALPLTDPGPCLDKQAFLAGLGLPRHSRVVVTVCRLVGYKGVFRLLNAARHMRSRNAVFLIAGEGELRMAAQEFIRDTGLEPKVKLLGHYAHPEDLYAVADLVVLCSDAEGQPYALLEAMRARRPILATAVPGNQDLLIHNRTGYLAEPDDSVIASAIDCLLENQPFCEQLGQQAYRYFVQHHTIDRQLVKLMDLYQDQIASARRKERQGA